MNRRLLTLARELVAVAVIGFVGAQLAIRLFELATGGVRPMYIDSWLFLVLLLGTALSVAGLLIGAVAIVLLWLRRHALWRRPRVTKLPSTGLVGPDGRELS